MSRLLAARGRRILATALIIALAFSAGVAAAAYAAASSGVISACVNDSSGTIKIVGPNESCKNHETKLQWNQQGPQGAPGSPGPQGPPGPAGGMHITIRSAVTAWPQNTAGDNYNQIAEVWCLPGEKVLGGGYDARVLAPPYGMVPAIQGQGADKPVVDPVTGKQGWQIAGWTGQTGGTQVTVFATCAAP